jgi:hypothetical protein
MAFLITQIYKRYRNDPVFVAQAIYNILAEQERIWGGLKASYAEQIQAAIGAATQAAGAARQAAEAAVQAAENAARAARQATVSSRDGAPPIGHGGPALEAVTRPELERRPL